MLLLLLLLLLLPWLLRCTRWAMTLPLPMLSWRATPWTTTWLWRRCSIPTVVWRPPLPMRRCTMVWVCLGRWLVSSWATGSVVYVPEACHDVTVGITVRIPRPATPFVVLACVERFHALSLTLLFVRLLFGFPSLLLPDLITYVPTRVTGSTWTAHHHTAAAPTCCSRLALYANRFCSAALIWWVLGAEVGHEVAQVSSRVTHTGTATATAAGAHNTVPGSCMKLSAWRNCLAAASPLG